MESEERLGFAYDYKNKFDESVQHFEKAIKIARTADNQARIVQFLLDECFVFNEMNEDERCLEVCRKVLPLALSLKVM